VTTRDKPYRFLGISVLIGFMFLITVFLLRISGLGHQITHKTGSDPKVAVIKITGPILTSEHILKRIRLLEDIPGIKGVLVHVNSPGGAVGPSQEIYEALRMMQLKVSVPMVATIESIGASGGYWIALAADKIYANAGTLTGSIGALMEVINLQELFQWLKIDRQTIKAGLYKDIGSANRAITSTERRILQSALDDVHQQFRELVVERRGVLKKDLHAIAEGQVFTGRQAHSLGLIDELGGFEKALADMTQTLGLKKTPTLFYPEPPVRWPDMVSQWGKSSMDTLIKYLHAFQATRGVSGGVQ
jgi:protease IV